MSIRKYLLLFAVVPAFCSVFANNVQINNVSLSGTTLEFTLSWENSWRVSSTAPFNNDAVWLFVKYRDCATNQWFHASLDSASANPNLQADTTLDRMGAMVYRSVDGVGNITNADVSLRMTGLPSGNFDFKVFGIEMVYVPQGAFTLGDGLSSGSFRRGTSTTTPYSVTSENAITLSNSGSNLYASASISTGTINAAWPKGFDPFYCMKYEISQGQYMEFLNTLTSAQAPTRYLVSSANRYTLTGAWPVITATAPNRAMSYLSWADYLAYLDWSGLRPMTELEFEKAARGPAPHVPGEYAWGTTLVTDANTVTNDGTASESVSNTIPPGSGIANYNNSSVLGPLRNGFNGSGTSNRLTLGASYYGICELSGNLYERTIYVGNSTGLSFRPNHGDGSLTSVGNHDVANWPTQLGSGLRGGSWTTSSLILRISDRSSTYFNSASRFNYLGGRGVRTPG